MKYWLIKSEPSNYSWDDFVADTRTTWDGVRNYAARNNLRGMKKGDRVFFYRSLKQPAIVGIAEVVKEAYQDPTTNDDRWSVVDIRPLEPLEPEISLTTIKADTRLAKMALIRISRLSVQPVTKQEWDAILSLQS